MSDTDDGAYLPTEEEIKRCCQQFQAAWTEGERLSRSGHPQYSEKKQVQVSRAEERMYSASRIGIRVVPLGFESFLVDVVKQGQSHG